MSAPSRVHFNYSHLSEPLQAVVKPFSEIVKTILETLPPNNERDDCLRKLLEAKDAAVRAHIQGLKP